MQLRARKGSSLVVGGKPLGAIEMPKSYRRNADEMRNTIYIPKADAKNQMLNTSVCQK